MSAGKTRMGGVFVEISAETKKFFGELAKVNKAMASLGDSVAKLGTRMAAVGGLITAPIMGAATAFAIFGDAVQKMAIRTGMSTEAVSGLSYAAQQSGTDMDTLAKGLRSMRSAMDEAAAGGAKASQAFAALRLNVNAMRGMSPEDQFLQIADALMAVPDAGARAALAMQIFGKAGVSLLPMLMQGSGGINALVAEAKRLGVVLDQDTADAAAKLGDAMTEIATAMKSVAMAVGGAVAPILSKAARIFSVLTAELAKFIKENKGMIRYALIGGAAITALGVALSTAGFAMMGLSAAFATFGAVAAVVLSPIGLLVGGLAALVAFGPQIQQALGKAFGGAGQAIGNVLSLVGNPLSAAIKNAGVVLADLGTIASNTFDGIYNAITAGNLMLAFDILMAGLYAGWSRGSEALLNAIDPWITSVQNLFTDMGTWIAVLWDGLWVSIVGATDLAGATLMGILDNIVNGIVSLFDNIGTWVAVLWDGLWVSIVGAADLAGATLMGVFDNIVNSILKAWDVLEAGIRKSWNRIQSFFSAGFNLEVENNKVDSEMKARARFRDLSRPGIAARNESAMMQDARRRDESRNRQAEMLQDSRDRARFRDLKRPGIAARVESSMMQDARRRDESRDRQAAMFQGASDTKDAREAENQRRRDARRQQTLSAEGRLSELNAQAAAEAADAEEKARKSQLVGGAGAAAMSSSAAEVTGTFSAFALGGLGFGNKQIDLLKEIADNTAKDNQLAVSE